MSNTVLNEIYSYSLKGATKMKQLASVSLQVHVSNHLDLLTLLKVVELTASDAVIPTEGVVQSLQS